MLFYKTKIPACAGMTAFLVFRLPQRFYKGFRLPLARMIDAVWGVGTIKDKSR